MSMETGQDQEQETNENVFTEQLNKLPSVDEKIRFLIDTMKAALAQERSPNFKTFWDAKHLCLTLFKENMPPAMRAHLWTDYIELSDEAKKLKNILDEQTAFAVEQIELAIKALEEDLVNYDQLLEQLSDIEIPEVQQMVNKIEYYLTTQRELNLLNTFAARINSLRKEVMKMEMRIRHKNKLFKSLSSDHAEPFHSSVTANADGGVPPPRANAVSFVPFVPLAAEPMPHLVVFKLPPLAQVVGGIGCSVTLKAFAVELK